MQQQHRRPVAGTAIVNLPSLHGRELPLDAHFHEMRVSAA